jgi:L-alanine-DL-glutamate epimerase-like enolase superfamily enzyme
MLRITQVDARHVRVPLERPTSFSTRRVLARDYTLVRARTDDGVCGIGWCYAGHSGGAVVAQALRDLLAPVIIGRDPFMVEEIWSDLYQESLLHGRTGSVMRALSALDTALWDGNARRLSLPLYKLLGGHKSTAVPAYASGGYYVDGKTHEDLGAEVRGFVNAGFGAVKIKVGRHDVATEVRRVAACREAIGANVLLMLDANNAWPDVATARRYIDRFAEFDPYWIEEPFSPDDIDSHVRLVRESSVPVATGEILAGRWRARDLLERGGVHFLQIDALVCGGVTEFKRIAAHASACAIPVCPHWFHDLHIHLVAALPNATFVEFFPDVSVLNFRRLITRQIEARHGNLVLPTGSGIGTDFDDAAVERYALGPWA